MGIGTDQGGMAQRRFGDGPARGLLQRLKCGHLGLHNPRIWSSSNIGVPRKGTVGTTTLPRAQHRDSLPGPRAG